jgi:hypothetical protein
VFCPELDPDPAFRVNLDTDPDHVQATGEAFSPQKRTSSTSKIDIYSLFYVWVNIARLQVHSTGFAFGHFLEWISSTGRRFKPPSPMRADFF